jgi:hypothetical protein
VQVLDNHSRETVSSFAMATIGYTVRRSVRPAKVQKTQHIIHHYKATAKGLALPSLRAPQETTNRSRFTVKVMLL